MKHYITKVWIESGHIYAQIGDGLVASYAISLWKRLASATEQQLNDFYLSYSGIHWPQLDEDLSFEGIDVRLFNTYVVTIFAETVE